MQEKRYKNEQVFFALVRAGLWGDVKVNGYRLKVKESAIDWGEIMQLAEEQSVVGLVAAGIETVQGSWTSQAAEPSAWLKVLAGASDQGRAHGSPLVPQEWALQFIGQTLQIEQRNVAMNKFLAELVSGMREADIYTLVMKGQGVAQCYEKPLWRSSGDVDFLLSEENFIKAREYLRPLTKNGFTPSLEEARHIGAQIGEWDIELHGNQFCGLSKKIDREIGKLQEDVFYGGNVRSWMCEWTQVFLPGIDDDVLFVFTHFLKHFYKGGLGLRQICDWCRLLYRYRGELDYGLLESRIRRMGLMSEWKAFGVYAVDWLGMPAEAMPLYDVRSKKEEVRWKRKAERINRFVMEVGNMGHSRDNSFYGSKSFLVRKIGAFGRRIGDLCSHAMIFPQDSLRFMPAIVINGLRSAAKGVG